MSIVERLEAVIKKRGSNFKRVERECGLGNGTIKRWETQSPRLDKLVKVSEYLQVSLDALVFGGSESETINTEAEDDSTSQPRFEVYCDGVPLTETEADLVAMFRFLDGKSREYAFDSVTMLYEKATGEKGSTYSTYTDTSEEQKSASDDDDNT
ncbi:MAG TPA: helix-turn-helix transcriptional regulator, partial [Clostridia bacterium]|nr:helix-turn-helix transcriptional regulator [Clostridia bacterium]